jgi:hypothetical protein
MNKIVGVSMGVLGLAVAGWLGGSMVAGQRAEAALQALKGAPAGANGGLRITQLQHERGWFGAKGQAEVRFEPGCSAEPGADEALTVRVDYTMSHLLLPNSLTRFDWQATPLAGTAEAFKAMFGSLSPLAGQGAVAITGAVRTEMSLPELSVRRAGEALQVAPSKGFLSVHGEALAFGWKVDRLVTRGRGEAMEVKDIAIDVDLRNRHLGTGTVRIGAEHVSLGVGTLEGVSLRSEASEKGDRLDLTVTPAIRRLKANGVDMSDLSLELAIKDMDTRSVETLGKVFEASCGMQAMTAEEGKKARDAAVRLLARGLSLGVPKISAKSADGTVTGQLLVALAEAKDGKPSLATQLKSNGRLEVTGTLVPADRRDMAVRMGFAVAKGTGLTAAFDYADGLLKVNDRTHDAGAVLTGLKAADEQLQTLVAGWSQSAPVLAKAPQAAPVEAPPAEGAATAPAAAPQAAAETAAATAPVAAPAAASPTTSAAECTTTATCVEHTLAAARKADIERIRQVAGQFDGMPKPDQGNRPVSRQLNSAGIDALKRDDFAGAVAKLRQAMAENPRDVEIAGNLGFALVKAGQAADAVAVLQSALVLDPRRTSTWTPLAEAYALAGRTDDAKAAMWVSFQWSANRDKSLAYYQDRAVRETRAPLQALYAHMIGVAQVQMAQAN